MRWRLRNTIRKRQTLDRELFRCNRNEIRSKTKYYTSGVFCCQNLAPGTNDREIMAVEIMNCQGYKEDGKTVRFVPVGFVDSVTGKLTIEEDKILWPGKTSTPPNR